MRLRPEDGAQGLQISDCRPETIAARSETKGGYAPTWFVSGARGTARLRPENGAQGAESSPRGCGIRDQAGLSPDPVCGPGQWRRGLKAGTWNFNPATCTLKTAPLKLVA